jgi:hypothetical protein
MKKGGVGGAKTQSGAVFEVENDLRQALIDAGFQLDGNDVWHAEKRVGLNVPKNLLYTGFLAERGVDHTKVLSKRLLPDEAFFNIKRKTLFIIEKKYQSVEGSVDEKLQTCSFKLRQYRRLCEPIGVKVTFIYLLNDWFKKDRYRDSLDFIEESGCSFFFDEFPLSILGI